MSFSLSSTMSFLFPNSERRIRQGSPFVDIIVLSGDVIVRSVMINLIQFYVHDLHGKQIVLIDEVLLKRYMLDCLHVSFIYSLTNYHLQHFPPSFMTSCLTLVPYEWETQAVFFIVVIYNTLLFRLQGTNINGDNKSSCLYPGVHLLKYDTRILSSTASAKLPPIFLFNYNSQYGAVTRSQL